MKRRTATFEGTFIPAAAHKNRVTSQSFPSTTALPSRVDSVEPRDKAFENFAEVSFGYSSIGDQAPPAEPEEKSDQQRGACEAPNTDQKSAASVREERHRTDFRRASRSQQRAGQGGE